MKGKGQRDNIYSASSDLQRAEKDDSSNMLFRSILDLFTLVNIPFNKEIILKNGIDNMTCI